VNELGSRGWSDIVLERRRIEARNTEEMDRSRFLWAADSVGQMGSLRWRGKVVGAVRVDTRQCTLRRAGRSVGRNGESIRAPARRLERGCIAVCARISRKVSVGMGSTAVEDCERWINADLKMPALCATGVIRINSANSHNDLDPVEHINVLPAAVGVES
jgi:hypothetical protein